MGVKKIPKACPECCNPMLELINLNLRCLKCGWERNLQPINDILYKAKKFGR